MKKAMLLAVATATVMSSSVAMAAPVELDGQVSFQYRTDTSEGAERNDGSKLTFTLNALTHLDAHFDAYARLGAQYLSRSGFHPDFAADDKFGYASIDQLGFIYKNAGVNYKIGRQAVTLGETALLYNNAAYIGNDKFADGVTATLKSGVTDLKVVAVREARDYNNSNKLYAVQASYKPAKDWKVGGVVAKYDYEDPAVKDTNHWAVNAGYTMGKAGLVAEYTKSNADDQNAAHAYGVTYDFDGKNSAYVYQFSVAQNGDIGGLTDFDPSSKGMYYGVDHKINKDATFSLFYKDLKSTTTDKNSTAFKAIVTYKF